MHVTERLIATGITAAGAGAVIFTLLLVQVLLQKAL